MGWFERYPFGVVGKTKKKIKKECRLGVWDRGFLPTAPPQLTFVLHLDHQAGGNVPPPPQRDLLSDSTGFSRHYPDANLKLNGLPSPDSPGLSHLLSCSGFCIGKCQGLGEGRRMESMPSGWGHWLGRSGSRGWTEGVAWPCVTAARPVAPASC